MRVTSQGFQIAQTVDVPLPLEQVKQNLFAASQGEDTSVYIAGNTLMISRKYLPTWALVVAIVGVLLFLLGLLALLIRDTETAYLQLGVLPDGGTRVVASGTLLPEAWTRISMTLESMGANVTAAPSGSQGAPFITAPPRGTAVPSGWFAWSNEGKNEGPLSFKELKSMAQAGKINKGTQIWAPSADKWQAAETFKELFSEKDTVG